MRSYLGAPSSTLDARSFQKFNQVCTNHNTVQNTLQNDEEHDNEHGVMVTRRKFAYQYACQNRKDARMGGFPKPIGVASRCTLSNVQVRNFQPHLAMT
jgi:hypothetical protein